MNDKNNVDNRVVADMSGIHRRSVLFPKKPLSFYEDNDSDGRLEEDKQDRPLDDITKSERKALISGSLAAVFLVVGIFLAVAAIVIIIMSLGGK